MLILHVEDDEHDVFFLGRAFKAAGIGTPVQVAADGQQALDYLSGAGAYADREKYPLPALIILDLKLPRLNGMEVLRWVRAQRGLSCVAVIIFSSSAQEGDVDLAYQLGANSFVVKPGGTQEREAFAQAIKEYWLGFNQWSVSGNQ